MQDHFHTHPKGRLHEIMFWAGSGLILGALAYIGWQTDNLSTPIALIFAVIALCLVGWSALPPARKPAAPPKNPRSKRR